MIKVRDIQRATAERFKLPIEAMTAPTRRPEHSRPRQMAMTLSSILTKHSSVRIGQLFNRDHSTVFHAVRQTASRCGTDSETSAAMREVAHRLLLEDAGQ